MSDKKVTVRKLAHASLLAIMKQGRYSNLEIDSLLKSSADLSESDRALYTRLVYGTIERQLTLDYIIGKFSSKKLRELDLPVLVSLRLGFYQLIYTDRIPEFAAVSETVDTAPSRSKGYVNGVLRAFLRSGKRFELPTGDGADELSIVYSTSVDICRVLLDSYGARTARRILDAFFETDRICLRVNTAKLTVSEAKDMLPHSVSAGYCDDILCVKSMDKQIRDGIERGLWFVQDEASRLCTKVLDAKSGELIADVCSAPGGKSFSAAIDAENKADVRSFDLHKNKLSLIKATAEKLSLSSISVDARDARDPDEALIGVCDKVLCDAPCSGFGVLAKKPDIRYKGSLSAERLPSIQFDVLCGASKYVQDGGTLVYSTCTLNKAENEEVVTRFLKENPEFTPVDFEFTSLTGLDTLKSENGMLTLFPHIAKTDGFFIAKMIKNIKQD